MGFPLRLVGLVLVVWRVDSFVAPNSFEGKRSFLTLLARPTSSDDIPDSVAATNDDGDNNNEDAPLVYQEPLRINGYTMAAGNNRYSVSLEEKGKPLRKLLQRRPVEPAMTDNEEDEDGWGPMRKKKRVWWMQAIRAPFKAIKKTLEGSVTEPGTLILVRHGESVWNANKTFTGWADPDLSERGQREVEHAARLLLEGGYEIDVCFTSRLKRAIRSAWILLDEMGEVYLPVFKSWRLNERHVSADPMKWQCIEWNPKH